MRQLAPERLAQLFVTLRFADTCISQQTCIQAGQLVAAGQATLPKHQVSESAKRPCSFCGCSGVFVEKVGTECTFHGVHPSACGGLESDLTGAHLPPSWPVSLDTVQLYCASSVNCLKALFCSYLGQLYRYARFQCILCADLVKTLFYPLQMTGTAVQFFSIVFLHVVARQKTVLLPRNCLPRWAACCPFRPGERANLVLRAVRAGCVRL